MHSVGHPWAIATESGGAHQTTRCANGRHPGFVDEEDAAFHLAQKLEDQSCLIVIDDGDTLRTYSRSYVMRPIARLAPEFKVVFARGCGY